MQKVWSEWNKKKRRRKNSKDKRDMSAIDKKSNVHGSALPFIDQTIKWYILQLLSIR